MRKTSWKDPKNSIKNIDDDADEDDCDDDDDDDDNDSPIKSH